MIFSGWLASALVMAHPPSLPDDACHDYEIRVARMQYSAFIDPTEDNWIAVWQRRAGLTTPPECEGRIDSATNTRTPVSEECRRRWEGKRCDLAGSEIAAIAAIVARFPEDQKESTRQRRFLALLDDPIAWRWAAEQLLDAQDPREWRPENVAIVVIAARRVDARAVREVEAASEPRLRQDGLVELPPHQVRTPSLNWFESYFYRLGRMGFRNAIELLKPSSLRIAGLNAPSNLREPIGSAGFVGDPLPRHFPLEWKLCQHEWESRSLSEGRPWFGGESGRPRRLWGYEREKYCAERWEEIDAAAPHPSIPAILEAVDRITKELQPLNEEQKDGSNR